MTLPLLKILANEIAHTNWSAESKQIFWTVSCIAFFGSFRMGKLLNSTITKVDLYTTLLWKDIKFNGKSWLIHVKAPKTRTQGGEYIDISLFQIITVAQSLLWKNGMKIQYMQKILQTQFLWWTTGTVKHKKILMTQFVASFASD